MPNRASPLTPSLSEFQLFSCVMPLVESADRRHADVRVGRRLRASVGAHVLAEIVVAEEDAHPGIACVGEVAAGIDRQVADMPIRLIADGARIGIDERLEILIGEAAAHQRAEPRESLDEIALPIDVAEQFGRLAHHAPIGQPRDRRVAGETIERLAAFGAAQPIARTELTVERSPQPALVAVPRQPAIMPIVGNRGLQAQARQKPERGQGDGNTESRSFAALHIIDPRCPARPEVVSTW